MLVKHISKLYNTMIKYYSTNASLWLNYIDFMIKEVSALAVAYYHVVVIYARPR